jgi:UDP-N-acetylglucosamine 2-epimerase (non-hydrolysing)
MKVMTFLGTRPEIIRLSRVIPLLDEHCEHTLVHTGQNYDERLNEIFFRELAVRAPNHYLGARADTFGGQIAQILERAEPLLRQGRPDAVLILGDTNSGLVAVLAARLRIPVYHMEAGNRCYDDRVPEEVNRRIIDHSSTVLLPYTARSRENLLREGIPGRRIFVTGNPIREVLDSYREQIAASRVLHELHLEPRRYFLVTLHRAENVDVEARLRVFADELAHLGASYRMPVIVSLHPRTRSQMQRLGLPTDGPHVRFAEPFGLFDFVRLEREASCVLTDSGTVQEECCLFGVPNVTLRDVTERPETQEAGSNMLAGADPGCIRRAVALVTAGSGRWQPPAEYLVENVSATVARIVLGYLWQGA